MNVAIVMATLPNPARRFEGGVTYAVHGLANALVRHGQRVTVFSLDPRPVDALYDHRLIPLPPSLRERWIGRYHVLTWYVAHLDFTGFDVLQTSGEDWLLPFRDTPPRIRTYWGSAIGEAWSSTRARRLLAQAFLFYPLEYASAVKTRRRVGISSITARQQPLVTDIIPPGVDVSTFHPGAKAPHPVILFVSHRLGGRKRGPALVEAFERAVKPALPDAELWMRCSEEVPSPEGVRWFKTVDPPTLADLYRKAWVMCLPSAYEGFGIPYVEALASGTAVVATPNYAAREILEDGKFGVLTSLSGLGQSLTRLLQDAPRLACLSASGPARARDFSWDEVAERYVAVYRAAVRA